MFGKIKQSNEYKTFENKSIAGSHRIQNKWIRYKIFKLNYGNTKVSNILR